MKNPAEKYLPLTHTTYFILISLLKPLHGYGIMQMVEEISHGEVKLGPGTLYGAPSKPEKQKLIEKAGEDDIERRKLYILTELGKEVVRLEYKRLVSLVQVSEVFVSQIGGMQDE